jgi:hypothetical protein
MSKPLPKTVMRREQILAYLVDRPDSAFTADEIAVGVGLHPNYDAGQKAYTALKALIKEGKVARHGPYPEPVNGWVVGRRQLWGRVTYWANGAAVLAANTAISDLEKMFAAPSYEQKDITNE